LAHFFRVLYSVFLLLLCLALAVRTSIGAILLPGLPPFCGRSFIHSFIRYGRAATKRELPPFCALWTPCCRFYRPLVACRTFSKV